MTDGTDYLLSGLIVILLFKDVIRPMIQSLSRKKNGMPHPQHACGYDETRAQELARRMEAVYEQVCVRAELHHMMARMAEDVKELLDTAKKQHAQ